ncbi:putative reverse transcriptase domain-containing protein, partial [Tanacetum coccineum]
MLAEVVQVSSNEGDSSEEGVFGDEDVVLFNDIKYPLTDAKIRMFKERPTRSKGPTRRVASTFTRSRAHFTKSTALTASTSTTSRAPTASTFTFKASTRSRAPIASTSNAQATSTSASRCYRKIAMTGCVLGLRAPDDPNAPSPSAPKKRKHTECLSEICFWHLIPDRLFDFLKANVEMMTSGLAKGRNASRQSSSATALPQNILNGLCQHGGRSSLPSYYSSTRGLNEEEERSSFEHENWVTSSSILSEFVDCSVQIYNGKTLVRTNRAPFDLPEAKAESIDVLLEEWPTTAGGESAETGTSVNRPESGRVSPATHVAPRGDEAISGEKAGRDSKELGEVFVPERQKWKDTKGEGYTPLWRGIGLYPDDRLKKKAMCALPFLESVWSFPMLSVGEALFEVRREQALFEVRREQVMAGCDLAFPPATAIALSRSSFHLLIHLFPLLLDISRGCHAPTDSRARSEGIRVVLRVVILTVTIHTWLERFNKQKPHSFEKAVAPVDAENWIFPYGEAYKQAKGGDAWVLTLTWAAFKELFFLQFFPRAEQERLKREYHSIRQRASENSTEYMQRFLRLAGFLGQAAGTAEEQAKNYRWGNLEILRDRDDYDRSERSDKRHKSGDRYQSDTQQNNYRSHDQKNDRQGSNRQGGSGNYRNNNNNNYSRDNNRSNLNRYRLYLLYDMNLTSRHGNRNSGAGRDQRNRGSQQSRLPSEGYTHPVCTTCGRRHLGECRRAVGTCFKCGQAGHLQRDCKKNTGASSSGHAGKKPDASGRVFALTQDQAANTS